MIYTAIGLFSLAAVIGIILLWFILKAQTAPKALAIIHGTVAAGALFILIILTVQHYPGPIVSLILFVLAAGGGLLMVMRDFTAQPVPRWLAVGHGIIAATALIILIFYATGG